ncbi:alpha-ketoacid dehydrogenase kinase N-terminal domain-containing protein [Russula earlei]|uniref:Alpha-ketoacid dehydrogenase kinase N-terminal domain-containing protein n=1 Tax=Russula earlei TaxID=71964 RepID=A0ACC0UCY4_9AGAM|nr:alpha-ketoacid dehydrogenase kinase N-terminal domain-containing protein [Russula earlei]
MILNTRYTVSKCLTLSRARFQSTNLHFYQNRKLEEYATKEAKRLSLRQLVFYGRFMSEERLIKSANYVRTELPVRIAHRIRDLQALPYAVVMQEDVAKVYELYWSAFEKFRMFPRIETLEDNESFCSFLRGLLDEHAVVIPNLSLGLSLASPHLPPDQLDAFMRRMLVSRISRRVLAEHHIALSDSVGRYQGTGKEEGHVGIICTGLNVEKSVRRCAALLHQLTHDSDKSKPSNTHHIQWPAVTIEGHIGAQFAYIREHLEYIIFELLKNAMQATISKHGQKTNPPGILVTLVAAPDSIGMRISDQGGGLLNPQIRSPSDLFSFSHVRNASRLEQNNLGPLRTASASPTGMRATVEELVSRWKDEWRQREDGASLKNDSELEPCVGRHPRLGIGLAMSNIFVRYFGGTLELVSLDGWGTDVYLRLPKLGTNLEGIEV